jgi:N-acetylglucosaminyldiphosphoundecaprenol N-acetyl-beta-D-mannosaminyltransferase
MYASTVPTSAGAESAAGAPGAAAGGGLRTRVLGAPVDLVDIPAAVERLMRLVEDGRGGRSTQPGVVVTLNPEMVMLARRDIAFAAVLDAAAMLVPDGIGVVRALRRRGFAGVERVGGVDLLESYLPLAARHGHRIALAGSAPGVAQTAARNLSQRFSGLQIVAAEGGAADARLAERLHASAPDVVCAAFGHGRQELFLDEHLRTIGAAVGVGVGGWLDYVAGTVRRAPAVVRNAGLEWAWRLAVQPSRLRRQLVLPAFWVRERQEAALVRRVRRRG